MHTTAQRGVLLIGRVDDPAPILALAKRLRWPVFADLLSNARSTPTPEQIRHFDYLIRSPTLKPDLIIHFGERFVSKQILDWELQTPFMHVSPHPCLQDPSRRITTRVQSDILPFCDTFQTAATTPGWLENWQARDHSLGALLETHFQSPPTEAHLYRTLPQNRPLFLGNGLPVRDADHFFFPTTAQGFFCNRGLSGIDGNIATAAGLSETAPLIAIIGDQAALHDLNSLPLIKNRPLLLIISNNFGGGIFEHLPVSQSPVFETHYAAAHAWHFESAARMFDLPYLRCTEPPAIWPSSGIVEFVSDRKKNHLFQKALTLACTS